MLEQHLVSVWTAMTRLNQCHEKYQGEDEGWNVILNLFRAWKWIVRICPKWMMPRKFGIKWCSSVVCWAELSGNPWTMCAQGFCPQPSVFVFCVAQILLWQCPTCKGVSDVFTVLGWRNLFMAFPALCCLKKCSSFEMSCSSCSKAPISSPSNFLHLIETHVFFTYAFSSLKSL